MAAAHLNAHVAGGNVELVVDYEQLLGLDLVLAAELGDGTARGIHVRLRLDQHNLALAALFLGIVDVDERDLGTGLVFPVRDAGLTGQLVDRFEASVVAGLGILIARVAKSGNHANLERLCSCHMLPFVTQKFNQRQRLPRPPKARLRFSEIPPDKSTAAAEQAVGTEETPARPLRSKGERGGFFCSDGDAPGCKDDATTARSRRRRAWRRAPRGKRRRWPERTPRRPRWS